MGITRQEWEEARQQQLETLRKQYWGMSISGGGKTYFLTDIDVSHGVQHNRPTTSQTTYYSKYPFHIHNGLPNYYSGSCTCSFAERDDLEYVDEDCIDDIEDISDVDFSDDPVFTEEGYAIYNSAYVDSFIQWLHDDTQKTLQLTRRISIPVGILGEVQWDIDYNIVDGESIKITFNWEQLANHTVVPPTEHTVTVTDDGHGSGTATPNKGDRGKTISITATASSGYHFKEWQVVSGDVTLASSTSATTTFVVGTENVIVKAVFEETTGT